MSKNTRIAVLIVVLCVGIICGVIGINVFRYLHEISLQLEDENGIENKELCLITDELIRENTEDYRMIKKHVVKKEKNTTGVSGEWADMDNDYTEIEVGKLSGIYICNVCLGNGKTVTYEIDSTVEEGNFRIVITNEQNEILYDVPYDQAYEQIGRAHV